jgi:GH24 family phage-related lysozyme (muramidase)
MNRRATRELIEKHEGKRHIVYRDSVRNDEHPGGILTIGVGFNLERAGAAAQIQACGADYKSLCDGRSALSSEQVQFLLEADLDQAILDAVESVSNFNDHPDEVQSVIVDMVFNLGMARFKKFKKTIACLEGKDYCGAANEMQNSLWAKQVSSRAAENIAIVRQFCNEL